MGFAQRGRAHTSTVITAVAVALALALLPACGSADEPPNAAATPKQVREVELAPMPLPGAVSTPTLAPAITTETAVRLEPPLRSFTMAFTGDNLTHSPLWRQAERNAGGVGFDFSPMYERVRHTLMSVDLAVCHLETPVAPYGEPLSTAPLYGVPPQVIDALAYAGYQRCSTASNHTFDRGVAGIETTVAHLERVGISQVGMPRTPDEAVADILMVRDVPIAHLSYTFGYNGIRTPNGEMWRSNLIDVTRIANDALDARRRGAAFVVVSLHDGQETSAIPTRQQREVAQAITSYGIVDLVVGHHAHVLQPIEKVNDRWVMYDLGNFISNMPAAPGWPASTQDGAIVTVQVDEQRDGSFVVQRPVVHPTWVHKGSGGFVIRLVQADLADPTVQGGLRTELEASLERTRRVLGDYLAR